MSSDDGSSEAGTPKGGDVTNERDLNGVKVAQQQPDDVGVPPSGQDQPGGGGGDDDDMLETSFFPSPAHYYKRYTSSNLALPLDSVIGGIGVDEVVTRAELEPPNVDWIVEGGSYSVFGDTWPVEEVLPTLEEQGVREMFTRGQDRSQSLMTLLRTMLLTYSSLVSALLAPPPSVTSLPPPGPDGSEPPSDPERYVEHIRLLSINMHHLVNELRPVQARENLKAMMRAQIEARRAKTTAIKSKCAELDSTLSNLRERLGQNVISEPAASKSSMTVPESREQAALNKLRDLVKASSTAN